MDSLSNKWKQAKEEIEKPALTAIQLIGKAKEKRKSVVYFHYGNIAVLTITLIAISFFFYYQTAFKELLSKAGVFLMLIGLLLRIVIEVFSTVKFRNIRVDNLTVQATNEAIKFYQFRKIVHCPITITIVAIYIIGFYFLTPEFSKYIPLKWMVIMDASILPGAAFLIWQIRKGIQKEMLDLSALIEIKSDVDKA